jgi:hypothetical protein
MGIATYTAPILVNEDTTYVRERIDHGARMLMFQRPRVAAPARPQLFALTVPRPSPSLFEDRFVSVFPVVSVDSQIAVPKAQQSQQISFRPSTRLDDPDPELQFHRVNHGLLFSFIKGLASPAFIAYTFEIPDLNGDPWVEWVPPHPPADLFPFRQIYPPASINHSMELLYWRSPNWRIEAEADSRPPNLAAQMFPFRQIAVFQPIVSERVMATQVGFYQNETRNIGDVFDINIGDFADTAVDYIAGQIGRPLFGWMVVVAGTTPLIANAPTPLTTTNKPRTVL